MTSTTATSIASVRSNLAWVTYIQSRIDRIWQIKISIYDLGESLAEFARVLTDIEARVDSRANALRKKSRSLMTVLCALRIVYLIP